MVVLEKTGILKRADMETVVKKIRWETGHRYYTVRVYQDLLGDWVIHKVWGGLKNNLGNGNQQVVRSVDDAAIALERIYKERRARRYECVTSR